MAASHELLFLILSMLISLTHSLECTKQTLTNNTLYTRCVDLPYLSSYLHWTYDEAKSSLSIAYVAPPAKPDGWIAWAINPTGTGMVGSQSLIAFKLPNGSMTVQTYNITSYGPIARSKIAYEVSGTKAEYAGGVMKLYATLALPAKMTSVNQVWQVGGTVVGGVPQKHKLGTANLNAMAGVILTKEGTKRGGASSGGPMVSPATSPSMAMAPEASPASSSMEPLTETAKAPAASGIPRIRNGFAWVVLLLAATLL